MEPVKKLFKNLNLLRRIYQIIQRDLIFNVLIKSLPESDENGHNDLNNLLQQQQQKKQHLDINYETRQFTLKSRITISNTKNLKRLNKYHQILYELNEKVLLLLNDKDNSDLKLLSNQTKLGQKYDFYKCGEYVLRLIPDIVYKMKLILKLCQKCYELSDKFNLNSNELLNNSKMTTNYTNVSSLNRNISNIQSSVLNGKLMGTKESTKISDYEYMNKDEIKYAINKRQASNLNMKPIKLPIIQEQKRSQECNNTLNRNTGDSYIRETDSSVISDDSNADGYENFKVKTPKKKLKTKTKKTQQTLQPAEKSILVETYQNSKPLPPIPLNKTNSYNDYTEIKVIDNNNNNSNLKERDDLYDEYLHKKDEIVECEQLIEELRDNLTNLINRTERCATIKDKINSVINVIRETESHINKGDEEIDGEIKSVLQKELNLLKYRLNLLTQDLDVEEIIKNELSVAINETNRKLDKAQNYCDDLNQQLNKLDHEIKILYKEYF